MKNIKSLLAISTCLLATNLLHAQEIQTQAVQVSETTKMQPPTGIGTPSPAPQFKPMNGIEPKEAPVADAKQPSPLNKVENKPQAEDPKVQALTRDANTVNSKLTPEQQKTMNGTAQRPKQNTPASTLTPVQPVAIKPAALQPAAPINN